MTKFDLVQMSSSLYDYYLLQCAKGNQRTEEDFL